MVLIALGALPAQAADVAVTGRLGYMSEWELTATAHAATTGRRSEFTGPMVIKHIGSCSPNGAVEKPGEIRFWRTGFVSPKLEGVISFEGEQCTFEAQEASEDGIMKCPNKGGVPLSLKVK